MRAIAAFLASLTLLAAGSAAAQEQPAVLEQGTRVRVTIPQEFLPRRWIVGTVVYAGPDSLTLRPDRADSTLTLGRAQILALQVSQPTRPRGPVMTRYALAGAVVGASVGAVLGVASHEGSGTREGRSRGEMAALGSLAFAVPTAAMGAMMGLRATGERWVDAGLPAAPVVSLQPGGGVGIALSVRL